MLNIHAYNWLEQSFLCDDKAQLLWECWGALWYGGEKPVSQFKASQNVSCWLKVDCSYKCEQLTLFCIMLQSVCSNSWLLCREVMCSYCNSTVLAHLSTLISYGFSVMNFAKTVIADIFITAVFVYLRLNISRLLQ